MEEWWPFLIGWVLFLWSATFLYWLQNRCRVKFLQTSNKNYALVRVLFCFLSFTFSLLSLASFVYFLYII